MSIRASACYNDHMILSEINFEGILGTAILVAVVVLLILGILVAVMALVVIRKANRVVNRLDQMAKNLDSASEFLKTISWPVSIGRLFKAVSQHLPRLSKRWRE